jgi:hypothetical protein
MVKGIYHELPVTFSIVCRKVIKRVRRNFQLLPEKLLLLMQIIGTINKTKKSVMSKVIFFLILI